jgi:hypothetical protein
MPVANSFGRAGDAFCALKNKWAEGEMQGGNERDIGKCFWIVRGTFIGGLSCVIGPSAIRELRGFEIDLVYSVA